MVIFLLVTIIRTAILYLFVTVAIRLMGKRQIGEMQPYEVVITLIIADLATLPMSDSNIPLLQGILPLAILVLIHFFDPLELAVKWQVLLTSLEHRTHRK